MDGRESSRVRSKIQKLLSNGPWFHVCIRPAPALGRRTAPVATVCHGTIGLLSARSGGAWLFAGYQMTGYTDEEESQGGPGDAAPFTLESRLRAEGANFTAGAPWSQFTVTDRNLITGQNPGSAAAVARQLVTALAP